MSGGVPARRAIVRWARRMVRREWRQQVLVLALLTLTVAGALLGVSAAFQLTESPQARFGTARQLLRYDGLDPASLAARVAATRDWFGTIDVIGHRQVPIAGLTRTVELRSQEPDGPYGAAMLRLLSGRYPTRRGRPDRRGGGSGRRAGGRVADAG